ncbi:hypothetical protein BJX64DRAFT_248124 [Aspergillus heterothallicus]
MLWAYFLFPLFLACRLGVRRVMLYLRTFISYLYTYSNCSISFLFFPCLRALPYTQPLSLNRLGFFFGSVVTETLYSGGLPITFI